ncbi:MAG: LytTR family DNA-binding domain-containing protein [Prolixibacteraceae bacterium]|nr:LytTR family DNA-binding domain-containing protein [Prolixibacteraceae bacterium]
MELTNISAIIIDDEPEAINLLEMYLRIFPYIKITGKETIAAKGLELAKETLPELVFLDIDMPDMNGLQVADKIQSENFYSEIVFTTAHSQYAYEALGVEPLDFLTKPFCIADIETVMQKFRVKAEKKKYEQKADSFIHAQSTIPKMKLPTFQGVLVIDIKDIVFMKSKANNCDIYLLDGSLETITRNMNTVIGMLNSPSFFRINRATCINLNYLKRVDKKNLKCYIEYRDTHQEEEITKSQMIHFEKLDLFPTFPNS